MTAAGPSSRAARLVDDATAETAAEATEPEKGTEPFELGPAERVACFGTDEAVPPVTLLRAGPLHVRLQGTRLLAVDVAGHEVWHGVAFLHRDAGWGTPEPVVDSCICRAADGSKVGGGAEGEGGFTVDICAHVPTEPAIDLRIRILGEVSGRIRYEGTAVPRGDIPTQRTGLVAMLPMSAQGRDVEIEHDDGRISRSTLPRLVPPWPPFMAVRAVHHAYADGAWACCRLSGDSFEFEDQRNNADASFKIYNRSNSMPRPYLLRAGVALTQSAELTLEGAPPRARRQVGTALVLGGESRPMPALGIGLAPEDLRAAADPRARVQALAPVRLHLVLDTPDGALDLAQLARCVAVSGMPLRLDVRDAAGVDRRAWMSLAARLQAHGIRVDAVAPFAAPPAGIDAVRAAFPGAAIGGGTPYFFAQANRAEALGAVDFQSFTVSAIVHGADDASPMEGLSTLRSLVASLRARRPALGVRIGPSGLAAPRSPLGPQPVSDGSRRVALARRDPRSAALYGGAWLVGYLAALAPCELQAIAIRGLGEHDGLFVAGDGPPRLAPSGWVLREVVGATAVSTVRCVGTRPCAALAIRRAGGARVLLAANLDATPLRVDVRPLPAGELHRLDAASWAATRDGLRANPWSDPPPDDGHWQLPAYGVMRLVMP